MFNQRRGCYTNSLVSLLIIFSRQVSTLRDKTRLPSDLTKTLLRFHDNPFTAMQSLLTWLGHLPYEIGYVEPSANGLRQQ